MNYHPNIDDYVIWKNRFVEGWVYFKCSNYITIEVLVRPKDSENYSHSSIHRNERLLVSCYSSHWNELIYSHSR